MLKVGRQWWWLRCRPPLQGCSTGLSWPRLRLCAKIWPPYRHAKWPHHLVAVQVEGFPMWCDVSTRVWRPVVPKDFRQQVFDTIHGLVHPGVCATLCPVSNRFVWPGLATDVKEWSRQCVACCRAKVTHVEHSGVEKIPIPGALFSHVQGSPEASPWQRGPQGHRAAQAWEAEDGLCGFYGSREARGPV